MTSKKDEKAVALSYDKKHNYSPVVSATGTGLIAENIIKNAKKHNIPVVEDESLVEILSELNINESIPESLYEAVSEVFAYIYQIDKKIK